MNSAAKIEVAGGLESENREGLVYEETKISDRGLAVFAFAIYHQLESGNRVTQVVLDDGCGHHADMEAIGELQRLGVIAVEDRRVTFTEKGEPVIDEAIASLRRLSSAALEFTARKQGGAK